MYVYRFIDMRRATSGFSDTLDSRGRTSPLSRTTRAAASVALVDELALLEFVTLTWSLPTGGLAHGELRSVERKDSDALLLLSLEAQGRLGLVLDLNPEVAHSQTLDRDG